MEGRLRELTEGPLWALFRVLVSSEAGSSGFSSVSEVVPVLVVTGVGPSRSALSPSASAALMMVMSVCSSPGLDHQV